MRLAIGAARLAIALAFTVAAIGGAQTKQRAFVRVAVHDSTGAPVTNAELTLKHGLRDVVAVGRTDDAGEATLGFEVGDSTDMQVTMRKIGYPRADRFFAAGPHDNARVTITVAPPSGATLAPVKVTAESNLLRKSYYLNADDIEASTAMIDNGWEVVKRLRPDMLTSRGGCATGVQEVWVNGKRIRLPLMPTGMVAARARVGVSPRARFSYVPVSVMSEIAPEHIKEILYHDCFDHTMAVVGSVNAMFVTLKPGVMYEPNVGSFVLDTALIAANKKK